MPTAESPSQATRSASIGRRVGGLAIDWTLSLLVTSAFLRAPGFDPQAASGIERVLFSGNEWATVAVWAAQHLVLVATLGTTIGHRAVGLKVVREDGAAAVGLISAAIRTALTVLVLPAIFTDASGRGYHDAIARTRLVVTR
ncbi:RDD family protein [Demequina capsici]|uniref:RDD family protein n=1 Tax=Demequina capsici TaxID=3075620 RepID=A0AA96FF45_9MICO|nr:MULTISPECIES: RDD family protein [unclassified Demequina]WNM25652.1 RDD family protein [Demequina sp. OYTSA14]WNM28547.1 RDD family protein [Demequina sp. PMTSA13]